MNRVLIIGATGTVGRQVVSQLMTRNVTIRAMSRNPEAARLPQQVEVLPGDLCSPETLDHCLTDVDTVFLVWSVPPSAVLPALDRIVRHARRVVFLSAPLKTDHPLFQQPNPRRDMFERIEHLIESAGIEWTFLRPGMFAKNALGWWASQIRSSDIVRWPFADLPTAPIHESDVAAVAVHALCENGHAGAEYVLTGREQLTHAEQVSTIGRAIGRPLRLEEVPPDEWRRICIPNWPAQAATMLLDAWTAAAGQPAFVTSTVEEITGRRARTFLQWSMDHADEFRGSSI